MLRRKRLGVFAVAAIAAHVIGCQELASIDAGSCGNEIIDVGEDCDGKVPSGVTVSKGINASCGAPTSERACRFECGPDPKRAGESFGCPDGYACGADFVCRAPSGAFDQVTALPASPAHVLFGDFDGDGLSDLLSLDDDSGKIDVSFFERDGAVARTFTIPSDGALPAIGSLAPSAPGARATKSFTISLNGGMGVMQGQPDRSFVATPYASVKTPWEDAELLSMVLDKDQSTHLQEYGLITLHKDETTKLWGGYVFDPNDVGVPPPKFTLPMSQGIKGWAPRLPVGNFVEDPVNSPCDEVILVPLDGNAVQAVSPRSGTSWNPTPGEHAPVHLPVGKVVKSAIAAHLNPIHGSQSSMGRDVHLDLVLESTDGGVFVAFGKGDGTFSSTPGGIPDVALPLLLPEMPLAVVDLNDDGAPDAVLPHGVFLSESGALPMNPADALKQGYFAAATPLQFDPWGEAVVVDFNGDGRLDIIASSPGGTGLQLFTNAGGGIFNPNLVATEQHADQLLVGDFDGDLQPDIAFRQGSGDGGGSVWVMFGRNGEAPLTPVSIGNLASIKQLVGVRDVGPPGPKTAISDIAVVTATSKGDEVALFFGRPDRVLQAPFLFFDPKTGTYAARIEASAIGKLHGGADTHGDVATVVSTAEWCVPDPTNPSLPKDSTDRRLDARLWLLRGSGVAEIEAAQPGAALCAAFPTVVWESAVLAPIDIDGDGQDEIIVVAPNRGKGESDAGALFVARATSGGALDLGAMIPLAERLYDRALEPGIKSKQRNNPVCVTDVDGDGHPDVVLLSVDNTSEPAKHGVSIVWGSADAAKPFSGSTVGHVSLEGAAAGESIRGFTCTDVDGDAARDIVVVTDVGAYVVHGEERDLVGKALVDGGGVALPGGTSVASDNIDDDGLLDLAISGPSGILVYRGKAKIP